jgi:dienelactone hydrolase
MFHDFLMKRIYQSATGNSDGRASFEESRRRRSKRPYVVTFGLIVFSSFQLQAQNGANSATTESKADVGQYYPWLQEEAAHQPMALSYLARDWQNRDQWRAKGRAKMYELLAYNPRAGTMTATQLEEVAKEGFTRYRVRYSLAADRETEAFLLIPHGLKEPAPAVVAIHDHGGFYYFGKEKITETEDPPEILEQFIDQSYGGRTYADELARRGFVVLVPDGFYFGSQRIEIEAVNERFSGKLRQMDPSTDSYIREFNRFAGSHETLIAKTVFTSGSTWPGILFQGDRASVDYLLTRPEVDPDRIGCIGLSIGGFRSAHLAGLDPRIKVSVVAGWMTTYGSLLKNHLRNHTWMIYVPGQLQYLDLPDVVSLNSPRPLMVINCLQDRLFTLGGMQEAEEKLANIYEEMDAGDRFLCRYYDVPHSLNVQMQNDAIEWLSRWLK